MSSEENKTNNNNNLNLKCKQELQKLCEFLAQNFIPQIKIALESSIDIMSLACTNNMASIGYIRKHQYSYLSFHKIVDIKYTKENYLLFLIFYQSTKIVSVTSQNTP